MGGLFKAPKPVIVQADPVPAAVAAVTPSTPPADQGQQTEAAAQARSARDGMQALIATSQRGVLDALPTAIQATRKSLLGE